MENIANLELLIQLKKFLQHSISRPTLMSIQNVPANQ